MTVQTSIEYTGNGATTDYNFPFEYLDETFVKVYLDGVATTAFTFFAQNTIRMNAAPANGVVVLIERQTDGTGLLTWADGAVIRGADLNLAAKISRHIAEESAYAAYILNGYVAAVDADATAAAASAAAAAASAADAASSVVAAASAYDQFDDRFLGQFASDPTLDNDGNALLVGALYFNNVLNKMKVYNGTAWALAFNDAAAASMMSNDSGVSGATVADALNTLDTGLSGKVPTTRTVSTSGLASGGGDLSVNRTIDVPAASQAEAEAGTDNAKAMTALRVAQAIATLNLGTASQAAVGTSGNALGKLNTANTWSAHQIISLSTLTDGATIDWSVAAAQKAKVTLGGNRTMNAVTGAVEGATYLLWVFQDVTGSRTLSWTTTGAGSFDFGADGAPTLTTTASKADLLAFEAVTIGGTLKLRFAGIKKGFA